jgi:hypothetical protein
MAGEQRVSEQVAQTREGLADRGLRAMQTARGTPNVLLSISASNTSRRLRSGVIN